MSNYVNLNFFESIILGLVQGLTEFLPISSSGHLVLAKAVLNIQEAPLLYDIFFHFATVLAVFTLFKNEIIRIIVAFIRGVINAAQGKGWRKNYESDKYLRLAVFIIIGSIPAAFIGLAFESAIKSVFTSEKSVAVFLWITGVILISTMWAFSKAKQVSAGSALLIGIGQAAALLPGISRSGATIAMGLWRGIKPEDAVKFSFFLAIPAILGANILEFSAMSMTVLKNEIWFLLAGGITAYLSGLAAIIILMKIIQRGRFFWFGIYCLIIGAITYVVV